LAPCVKGVCADSQVSPELSSLPYLSWVPRKRAGFFGFLGFFWQYSGPEFALRTSCLLERSSTTWATLLALFCVGHFQDRVSWSVFLGLASNHSPLHLYLPSS
jgi:hypothetical protein